MQRVKPTGSKHSVEQIVWAVRVASRYVPKSTCLAQALAVQRFLAGSGHSCLVRIGVAKDPILGFEFHAWVECDGRVVIGEADGTSVTSHFTPIAAWER